MIHLYKGLTDKSHPEYFSTFIFKILQLNFVFFMSLVSWPSMMLFYSMIDDTLHREFYTLDEYCCKICV